MFDWFRFSPIIQLIYGKWRSIKLSIDRTVFRRKCKLSVGSKPMPTVVLKRRSLRYGWSERKSRQTKYCVNDSQQEIHQKNISDNSVLKTRLNRNNRLTQYLGVSRSTIKIQCLLSERTEVVVVLLGCMSCRWDSLHLMEQSIMPNKVPFLCLSLYLCSPDLSSHVNVVALHD